MAQSIMTQSFQPITIPIVNSVTPYSPFMIRPNATIQIAEPLAHGKTLQFSCSNFELGATLREEDLQSLFWGVGPLYNDGVNNVRRMLDFSTTQNRWLLYYPDSDSFDLNYPEEPSVRLLRPGSIEHIVPSLIVSYSLTATVVGESDWTLEITETMPGRTPDESIITSTLILQVDPTYTASRIFPMTIYFGWPNLHTLYPPLYTEANTPGVNRGLIYSSISVA